MRYVISISDESERKFFFAGWESSDTHPEARNASALTYWREDQLHDDVYHYEEFDEPELEIKLLLTDAFEFTIGLPVDFGQDVVKLRVEQVKVSSYGR